MRPEDYLLTTDFATLKNDATGTLTVTLPNTLSIPGATTYQNGQDITIGTSGASFRARMGSTKNNKWYNSTTVVYAYSSGATVDGSPSPYIVFTTLSKISADVVRLTVFIPNGYGSTMSISGLSQTITAVVATFLPPHA